jgi:hypothetical protein
MVASILLIFCIIMGALFIVIPFLLLLVGILLSESPWSIIDRWTNRLDLWLDRHIIHPSRYK